MRRQHPSQPDNTVRELPIETVRTNENRLSSDDGAVLKIKSSDCRKRELKWTWQMSVQPSMNLAHDEARKLFGNPRPPGRKPNNDWAFSIIGDGRFAHP